MSGETHYWLCYFPCATCPDPAHYEPCQSGDRVHLLYIVRNATRPPRSLNVEPCESAECLLKLLATHIEYHHGSMYYKKGSQHE